MIKVFFVVNGIEQNRTYYFFDKDSSREFLKNYEEVILNEYPNAKKIILIN